MAAARQRAEDLPSALIRIERDFHRAIAREFCPGCEHPHDRRVHDARRTLKRLRALLRLLGEATGQKRFAQLGRRLRDVGRAISSGRDAAVSLARLDELLTGEGPFRGAKAIRARLSAELRASRQGHIEAAARRFARYGGIGGSRSLARIDREKIAGALRGLAAREERRMLRARAVETPVAFHEWRKRLKDLWAAGEIANGLFRAVTKHRQRRLKRLADILGEMNDWAVLARRLRQEEIPETTPASLSVARRIERLGHRALRLRGD
jgi:CHAD domain-containing protein